MLDAAKHETKYSENLYSQKTRQFAQRFRKLSKENEEDLAIVKVQYAEVQEKYLSALQRVEEELTEVIEKGRLMHNRRATERAAFHGEIQGIRIRSGQHDKEIKKLKSLIEEERNDDFIDLLEGSS